MISKNFINHSISEYESSLVTGITHNIHELESWCIELQSLERKYFSRKNSHSLNKQEKQLREYTAKMMNKLQMQLIKHEQAIGKITEKIMSDKALNSLKSYLDSELSGVAEDLQSIRQIFSNMSHQKGADSILVTRNKVVHVKKIKKFREEINGEWQRTNQNISGIHVSHADYHNDASNMKHKPTRLEEMAMDQLQKQFLTIRMISYKMYEKFIGHTHEDLAEELRKTNEEQQKLRKQLQEAKQIRTNLIGEQKQLSKQLTDLKKCNQAIGRRYFILKDESCLAD